MAERRHPNVVNIDEARTEAVGNGKKFVATMRWLAREAGASKLGCSMTEVPPGKTAFPRHYHCVNEEAVFVLEGEGTLRIGEQTVPVRAGDYVAFPAGPAHAHQILNTGAGTLRYLGLSTQATGEIVGYPDSKKIGIMAAPSLEAAFRGERWLRVIVPDSAGVGYFDGEDD
jgi:uncharacterized cupin superfamily protein